MRKQFIVVCILSVIVSGALAQSQVPGQSYYGSNQYTEYIHGTLPVIISAPHGGRVKPSSIPNRSSTCGDDIVTVLDTNTEEVARAIDSCLAALTGQHPHTVICLLSRQKMDANRALAEAACGNAAASQAWWDYQNFIDSSVQQIIRTYGRGLFIDVHGHGHDIQRNEIGYLLTAADLRLSDSALNTPDHTTESGIRYLTWNNLTNSTHAELLRGPQAFGTMLATAGYASVPSAQDPYPLSGQSYFNGGYNTWRWGSRNGGRIDAFQIETNYTGLRDNAPHIAAFGDTMAHVIMRYMQQYFSAPDTPQALSATALTPGNLLTTRFVTGASGVQKITVLEIDTTTHAVVQSFDLPSAGPDAITLSTVVTDGQLQLSGDGRYVTTGAYYLDAGATVSITTADVNRTVGVLDANTRLVTYKLPNTSASAEYSDPYNASNIRSAYTTDGSRFYTAGGSTSLTNTTTGVWTFQKDSVARASQLTSLFSSRWVQVFNNTLYAAAQSVTGRPQGIFRFNTALPQGASDTVRLFTPVSTAVLSFAFTPDSTTCYVADNSSSTHIEKWQYNGSAWVHRYTLNPSGITTAPRAMTMMADSTHARLFITYGTQIIQLKDSIANTLLSAANTTPRLMYAETGSGLGLRGVCFTPSNVFSAARTVVEDKGVAENTTTTVKAAGSLQAYPNPAGDKVTIRHEKANANASLYVVSMHGVALQSIAVQAGATQTPVAMQGYAKGTYIVVFANNGKKSSVKIIK